MDFKELLPIGSVVLLKDAVKKLMIYGVGQTDTTTDKDYDYIGVMYPEGNMGEGSQYLFNHGDIEQVFFRGFSDNERDEFIERLKGYYENN
ncbi:MAG: DUF4176 domain-containing protein [Ruminococcaceae bacterium]|nr:DUF4176 domain-containing protein [Oscillospiraceae bacterium]